MNFSIKAATSDDWREILALQEQNYIENLAPDARGDGFISTPFTREILEELRAPNQFFIARETQSKAFAGYVFCGSWAFCARWPAFQIALSRFPLNWEGNDLRAEETFQYGPVCVAKNFRGQGVLPALFERVKEEMRADFSVGTTWINRANSRSMRAHTQKLGFLPLDEFEFDGKEFVILGFSTV